MRNSSRVIKIGFLVFGALLLVSATWAQNCPPAAKKIAKAYGLDSWGQIDAIRYTFNLDLPALKLKLSRRWVWEPKADRVTYEGKDKAGNPVKVTYVRSQLSSQPENIQKEIDPGFINDQYWLIFPFHTCWDTAADVQDKGMQRLPLGKGSARLVSVKYPSAGGYTPGDTWDLYVGSDNRVEELLFRHGVSQKPTVKVTIVTWAGHKKAGPLLVSTDHRGRADGKPVTITFTNVAVKLTGSDTWVNAQQNKLISHRNFLSGLRSSQKADCYIYRSQLQAESAAASYGNASSSSPAVLQPEDAHVRGARGDLCGGDHSWSSLP